MRVPWVCILIFSVIGSISCTEGNKQKRGISWQNTGFKGDWNGGFGSYESRKPYPDWQNTQYKPRQRTAARGSTQDAKSDIDIYKSVGREVPVADSQPREKPRTRTVAVLQLVEVPVPLLSTEPGTKVGRPIGEVEPRPVLVPKALDEPDEKPVTEVAAEAPTKSPESSVNNQLRSILGSGWNTGLESGSPLGTDWLSGLNLETVDLSKLPEATSSERETEKDGRAIWRSEHEGGSGSRPLWGSRQAYKGSEQKTEQRDNWRSEYLRPPPPQEPERNWRYGQRSGYKPKTPFNTESGWRSEYGKGSGSWPEYESISEKKRYEPKRPVNSELESTIVSNWPSGFELESGPQRKPEWGSSSALESSFLIPEKSDKSEFKLESDWGTDYGWGSQDKSSSNTWDSDLKYGSLIEAKDSGSSSKYALLPSYESGKVSSLNLVEVGQENSDSESPKEQSSEARGRNSWRQNKW